MTSFVKHEAVFKVRAGLKGDNALLRDQGLRNGAKCRMTAAGRIFATLPKASRLPEMIVFKA